MEHVLKVTSHCIACDNCKILCPENSIFIEGGKYIIENWSCTLCGICIEVCPIDCIKIIDLNQENIS